jgi:hypothetical protein
MERDTVRMSEKVYRPGTDVRVLVPFAEKMLTLRDAG